ncbi:hydrogenase maturation protease [Thauera aromatica]|uniref:NAD-reducing hydrogenase maturation factor HoxW n=1 Tax=Thauera aromatica K172 TaxID=44139 RepID=A0A2R4BNI4_THAAR|nr:hydrogenase maturation protease [Thauera aromatica]AVR88889.1 NAD-reducing hydrogenase maturation factor HoxW [Thauera aromatica K172]
MTVPVLVFGWGNPSRGDDALGPLFIEAVMAMALPGVECLTDFQLQVEHALDLRGRERVLFVDASSDATAPFTLCPIEAARDVSYSSHAVSPQSILQVYRDLEGEAPPPCWQLAIRGEAWTLGSAPGNAALHNLKAALRAFDDWLDMRA